MADDNDERYADVDPDGALGGFEVNFVDVDGIRTRYYDVGEGPPLLLLHGGSWGGSWSANTWSTNLAGLSQQFRVLAPDRIATGMTGNPPDESGYVYGAELAHVTGFVDALGIESVHLVGQSRGAGLAGHFLLEEPERVETFVAVNNRSLAPDVGDFGYRRFLLARGQATDPTDPAYHEDRFRHMVRGLSYDPGHISDRFVRTAAYMRSRPKAKETDAVLTGETLERLRASKAATRRDIQRRLGEGESTIPMLLCWGRNDPIAPLSQGVALFDMLTQQNPNVRLYVFDRSGHVPYREHPEEFNETVRAFVHTWQEGGTPLNAAQPEAYRSYYRSDD